MSDLRPTAYHVEYFTFAIGDPALETQLNDRLNHRGWILVQISDPGNPPVAAVFAEYPDLVISHE